MPRDPSTGRGHRTRRLLLDATAVACVQKGFHGASISAICRAAGVANGSFYQYFPDKEAAYQALLEELRKAFVMSLSKAEGPGDAASRLFDLFEAHGHSFQAFREAEFLETGHPRQSFYDEVIPALASSLGTSEAVAWAVFGAQSMVSLHIGNWGEGKIPRAGRRAFLDIMLNGIAPTPSRLWEDLQVPPLHPASPGTIEAPHGDKSSSRGEQTRHRLIASGRSLFATTGYARTPIADITRAAGTALGTFYLYFPSKRDLLAELVHRIRAEIAEAVERGSRGVRHRLERERRSLLIFLVYLAEHGEIYRIVREAEFSEPPIGRSYYEEIADQYSSLIESAQLKGQVRPGDARIIGLSLMGATSIAGMRWVLWNRGRPAPHEAIRETLKWTFNGLDRL